MSHLRRRLEMFLPKGFLWRLTYLNSMIIAAALLVSGWAVYQSACFLVADIGDLDIKKQQLFNTTLLKYILVIIVLFILISGLLHFYSTKRLIAPIRNLIWSTKKMKYGQYPEPIEEYGQDEMGQLVKHYNELIKQLYMNDQHRKKLVTDLSHEIRTPLSNINGYLQALANGDLCGDRKLFSSLHQEARRLTQMLEQLEQLKEWDHFSSQTIRKFKEVEITELTNQCVASFEWISRERGIPLKVDIKTSTLMLHVEGFQQVMSNLIDNAIRYYEGSGPINVTGKRNDDCYRISVTGPGRSIREEEKDLLFKRFYRPDSSRSRETGGSGLGLAITKEIIDVHHGEIGMETSGDANTFWFEIPITPVQR